MRSSLSFPNWAKPSYLSSQPSRAKVEHFNFQAETKLKTKNGNLKSECTTEGSLNAGLDNLNLHEKLFNLLVTYFREFGTYKSTTNILVSFKGNAKQNSFWNILISIEKLYLENNKKFGEKNCGFIDS